MSNIKISNHQPQDITIKQNDNQLIFVNGGGEVIGITDVLVNGNSVVQNNIAYVLVPTMTNQLTNNSGFLTSETDPTVPSIVKTISQADIINWNNKQNALVSGNNIKTINNESLLGSGNINIEGNSYTAGVGIDITNDIISNEITSYNDLTDLPTIPTKVSDLINDSDYVSSNELSEVAYTGSYGSLSDTPIIPDSTSELINDSNFVTSSEVSTEIQTAISTKQDTLVSGTNIKTINNNSLLGSGNINISSGPSYTAGTGINITNDVISNTITSYNDLSNLPTIPTELKITSILFTKTSDQNLSGGTYNDISWQTQQNYPNINLSDKIYLSSGKIYITPKVKKIDVCLNLQTSNVISNFIYGLDNFNQYTILTGNSNYGNYLNFSYFNINSNDVALKMAAYDTNTIYSNSQWTYCYIIITYTD